MNPSASVAAPAKLNLGLRIVGRRSDGLHELESVFVPLDLADTLELEVRPEPGVRLELTGADESLPRGRDNLAARAARAFLDAGGLREGVWLRLGKRIPVAAGLGGGSSDAGAVLRGLRTLFPNAVPPGRLADLALELGADVPFFLAPRPARVGGVGERIEPLDAFPRLTLLLANPGIALSTREVFRAFDALGATLTPSKPISTLRLDNDLEPAAVRLCPPIARLRERLRSVGAEAVGMTGSGPTVFGLFPDEGHAAEALREAAFAEPVWARVAVTVTVESPPQPG